MAGRRLNIGSEEVQEDINYRYQMDPLQIKIEGRGNGIKTILVNIAQIAADCNIEPMYITKYLGVEVGAQSGWHKARDVGIVNGAHRKEELQGYIFGFIKEFILCPTCHFPELQHKVNVRSQNLQAKCYSCGWNGKIRTQHRTLRYIIGHPPTKNTKMKKGKPSAREDKKKRRADRDRKRQKAREQQEDTTQEVSVSSNQENYANWHIDADNSILLAEKEKALALQEKHQRFFVKNAPETPVALLKHVLNTQGIRLVDIVSEFERIKVAHGLDEQQKKLGKVLVDAVFDFTDFESFKASVEKHTDFLSWYSKDDSDSALILISYIEEALTENRENLLPWTPMVLEVFYDKNIFNAAFLDGWFEQPPQNSYVVQDVEDIVEIKRLSEPFIFWIKSILTEDDAEDEQEETVVLEAETEI